MKEFDYDMINRYLDDEMNPMEKQLFEEQLQTDVDLKNEVTLLKDVQSTIKTKLHPDENETTFRNSLNEMNVEFFSGKTEKAKVISIIGRKWMTAIAAIFIMALLLTVWQPWKKEDLYIQYASIQMPGIAERGAATDSLLNLAIKDFNDKRFSEAIPLFEAVLKDSVQNSFVQYYHGIALLQNGEITKSRVAFTALYNGSSLFKYDAVLYMALSYLKEKNNDACKEWLKKIPADADNYSKAQELMKKL